MDKIKIRIDKEDIELLEFMPTFYKVAEITNPLLEKMKQGMKTWTSEETYKKMQVSVWVVNDTRVNAFAIYYEGKNYIALTVGLCDAFWNAIEDFVGNKNFSKGFLQGKLIGIFHNIWKKNGMLMITHIREFECITAVLPYATWF